MHFTHRLVPGILAGSLLVGGASGVFAAKAHVVQRGYAYGQVSNLSAAGFTLTAPTKAGATTAAKTVQVTLSTTAKETARKGTTGALANSEYAVVVGVKSAAGITANRVLYASTAFKGRRVIQVLRARAILNRARLAVGTVNATTSTSTSLAITTKKGKTLTFTITPQTKFRVNKQLVTTAPVFTATERVRVRFVRNAATKTFIARVVAVLPAASAQQ